MPIIIATILIAIFLFLSGIHFYWAFGGHWGNEAVIPTKDDAIKVMMPGIVPTLMVALGLLGFAFVIVMNVVELNIKPSLWLDIVCKYGLWVIASIFVLRAIGEFNYVGFFKKYRNTVFGQKDTIYYSPLCLIIGILIIMLEMSK